MYSEVISDVTKYNRGEVTREEWHAVHQTILQEKKGEKTWIIFSFGISVGKLDEYGHFAKQKV